MIYTDCVGGRVQNVQRNTNSYYVYVVKPVSTVVCACVSVCVLSMHVNELVYVCECVCE